MAKAYYIIPLFTTHLLLNHESTAYFSQRLYESTDDAVDSSPLFYR